MNVDKLVETIDQAIKRVGGETARIWPDLVASYYLSAWITLVAAGIFAAIAAVGLILAVRWYRLYFAQPKSHDREGPLIALGFLIGGLILFEIILICIVAGSIPDLYYPEAELLRSLLRK